MSSDSPSDAHDFARFLQEQLQGNGIRPASPEEYLQLWRAKQATNGSATTESLGEALRRNGLLGSISGTPADLSSNSEHMEGFGKP